MKYLCSLLLLVFILSSCGPKLSPFTQRLYEDQRWTERDLERIQFYLSEDLVLRRELRDGRTEIVKGEIKIIDGREVEQVVFKRNTPGVYVFSPKENRLAISFEDNDDNYLIFGPNPKYGNRYAIRGKEMTRRGGVVTYAGREWRISGADGFASLLVPLKRLRNQDVKGRVVGGRRID
ncbi:MAG: hypothetical protein AAFQ37_14620 [Bacteroidota bacterium]